MSYTCCKWEEESEVTCQNPCGICKSRDGGFNKVSLSIGLFLGSFFFFFFPTDMRPIEKVK